MTDQSNIFDDTNTPAAEPAPAATPADNSVTPDSVFTDQLKAITNERGEQKYDTVPKALEGLRNAQEFIPQLQAQLDAKETELAQLREAATKHSAVEDVVSRLTASQSDATTVAQGLDEQGAAALFEQMLAKSVADQSAASNQQTVQEELVTKFGSAEAANKAVLSRAAELGTTAEELGRLSATNPLMVLEYFKTVQGVPSGSPENSSINSAGLLSQQPSDDGVKPPAKSLLAGASTKEQVAYMEKIKADVYKKFGVET